MKQFLTNDRGDLTIGAVILILFLNLLTAFLMLFASVQAQTLQIRNSVTQELNNLSAVIAADTHRAMREGNLEEYEKICNSEQYHNQLRRIFTDNLSEHLQMDTRAYHIERGTVEVENVGDAIRFTYTADVQYRVHMFGSTYPVFNREIRLSGSHTPKF